MTYSDDYLAPFNSEFDDELGLDDEEKEEVPGTPVEEDIEEGVGGEETSEEY